MQPLLSKDPADRPATADELLASLATIQGHPLTNESGAIRDSYLQAARFVGREQEMTTLTNALHQAQVGYGSAWLVGGESGVGKSRLLRELQTEGLVNGFQLLIGQSGDGGSGGPYQIWQKPLQQMILALANVEELAAGTLLQIVPDISRLLNRPIEPAPSLASDAAKMRLYTTVATLFRQIERPILLVLEDLHRETESLSLLSHLVTQIEALPLVVVGSYRNEERPELADTLSEMQLITLDRLSEAQMSQLSESMLGEIGRAPEVVNYLQRETEGNAFFAVEVVRALIEEAGRRDLIQQNLLPEKLLTTGIKDVVERLVRKVPTAAQPLLRMAAVAGRQLDIELLKVADDTKQDVDGGWLQTCADSGILELQDGKWRFRHDKLREWLLDDLAEFERQHYHYCVAVSIELLYKDVPATYSRLAHHWAAVGESEKERSYAILAGDFAQDQYLLNEAAINYERAIELMGPLHSPELQIEKIDLLNKLAAVLTIPDPTRAYALAEEARTLATSDHLIDQPYQKGLAQSINQMGRSNGVLGQHSKAFELYEEAAPLLKESGDFVNYAHTLFQISSTYYNRGFNEQAGEYIRQAKDIGEELDNKSILARAHMGLSIIDSTALRLEGVTNHIDRALELMREIGDLRSEAMMLLNYAVTLNKMSKLEEAVPQALAGLKLAEEINDFQIAVRVRCNLVSYYTILGDYDAAWEQVKIGLSQVEGKPHIELEALVYISLFTLLIELKGFDLALEYTERAEQVLQKIEHPHFRAQLLNALIDIYKPLGDETKVAQFTALLPSLPSGG